MIKSLMKAALGCLLFSTAARAAQVGFSEIMYHPMDGKPEFLEVWNYTNTPLDTALWRMTNGVDYTFPDFNPASASRHILGPKQRVLISSADEDTTRRAYPEIPATVRVLGPWDGALDNAGEKVELSDKNGVVLCMVDYKDGGRWSPVADGTGHSLVLVNEDKKFDDPKNWKPSARNGGSPGTGDRGEQVPRQAVPMDATWKYNDLNVDLGTEWRTAEFDDSAWPSGQALLGYEPDGAVVPSPGIKTPLRRTTTLDPAPEGYSTNLITHYFRTSFQFDGVIAGATFSIDDITDDGAAYYLNGVELGRRFLAANPNWKTPASQNPVDVAESRNSVSGAIPAGALKAGVNVLAVELHNNSSGSNDSLFGVRFTVNSTPVNTLADVEDVALTEVHFDEAGLVDWVEVENRSTGTRNLGAMILSSATNLSGGAPLSGTLEPGQRAVFQIPFTPDGDGSIRIFLATAAGKNVLDCAPVRRRPGRPSVQAVTRAGVREWIASTTDTRSAPNAPTGENTSVVMNEIMLDQPGNTQTSEYIELYNKGTLPVDLTGWEFDGGIDYLFPAGTVIQPGAYLVVAADAARLMSKYPGLTAIGNWDGGLSAYGEMIRLIDAVGNPADVVDYNIGGDWPALTAGDGSSMELIHPDMDNSLSSAWRDSDETNKAPFQTFTITGPFRQLRTQGGVTAYKELHMHLVGDSHIEFKNFNLQLNGAGANLLPNTTKMATSGNGATGWLAQGTHWASFMQDDIFHLISDGHGDNRANRAEIDATAMVQNSNYTLTFEARWVSGNPRLIVQTWDHSFGASILIPIPDQLGTPGKPNSRAAAAPAPQVDELLHSPPVPNATTPVRITARVFSAEGLTSVIAKVRADDANSTNPWADVPMNDAGADGDATAGDGLYTATVSNHMVNNRIVQFYVEATGQSGGVNVLPRAGAVGPGLWMVDNRTTAIPTALRRARYIVSAYHQSAMVTSTGNGTKFGWDFPRLSNHYFPCTFISDEKNIYYGAGIRKTGSPWTRSDGSELSRARWNLPRDRRFRNRERFSYDNDTTEGRAHHNRITRYFLYLLGIPTNEAEFVHVLVNAAAPVLREETEPESKDYLDRIFEDGSNGQLYRIDDEWWFDDAWTQGQTDATWTYKGTDDPLRYHSEWMTRSREWDHDYSSLTSLMQTVSTNTFTQERIDRILDREAMAKVAAVRGYIGDWDSFTLNRGKNSFLYRKKEDGLFMLLQWDSDLAFQGTGEVLIGSLGGVRNYLDKPYVRRLFNYYLTELLTKYTKNSPRTLAWLDAEEAASSAYTVAKTTYTGWFTGRESRARQEINLAVGGGPSNSFTAVFAVTTAPGAVTSDATFSLSGRAPSNVHHLEVDGHPEAVISFTNQQVWSITGIVLAEGLNQLVVKGLDAAGNTVQSATYDVTKTGNAPPVAVFTADPASRNVSLGEPILLEGGESYDPDGGDLTFEWTVTPAQGSAGAPGEEPGGVMVFSVPGVYQLALKVTDSGGLSSTVTRDVTVYSASDFSSFGTRAMPPWLTPENVSHIDNSAPDAWFSLEARPGGMTLRLNSAAGARPLTTVDPRFPVLWRDVPDSGDWVLNTKADLTGREFGGFFTGVILETTEGAAAVRYAFGMENGTALVVKRAEGQDAYANVASIPWNASGKASLRVRRAGATLKFETEIAGAWTEVHSRDLAASASAGRAGLMVSTSPVAQTVETLFDYFLLADPSVTNPVLESLRITELMYNPASPDGPEWIELRNTGATAISLAGVTFQQGDPFDQYTFGAEVLAPGEFTVVTDNLESFRRVYGPGPRVSGEWPGGNLNNGGEHVVLLDSLGNPIHDFDYFDIAPWPEAPDGKGPSLEVNSTSANYNDPLNWRASYEPGGTPGYEGAGVDTDGDGMPDSLELVAGTDPASGASRFAFTTAVMGAGNDVVLGWTGVAGRTYKIETTLDPAGDWTLLQTLNGAAGAMNWTDTLSAPAPRRFYRMRVAQP